MILVCESTSDGVDEVGRSLHILEALSKNPEVTLLIVGALLESLDDLIEITEKRTENIPSILNTILHQVIKVRFIVMI